MTSTTQTISKIVAVVAGLTLVVGGLMVSAHAAQADTMMFSANLTIGSTGADVTSLQTWLIAQGYSIPAGATGYFGAQTQAAVAAYQTAKGISPAAGYFGPLTRASVNAGGAGTGTVSSVPGCVAGAMFSSTTGQSCSTSTGTTGLTGVGRLTNISSLGDVSSDLRVGDDTTAVVGVSADATDGDVALQRVDATLTIAQTNPNSTASSASINKYVDSVSLYLNDTKIATMDASEGDKDGRVWTYRFAGLNGIIKKGTTGNIHVEVTPVSSIGANEDGEHIIANIPTDGVRAVGSDGISETYVTGSGLTSSGVTISSGIAEDFTVSSASTGKLTLSSGSNNPTASQQKVDVNNTTTGVKLLEFNAKSTNSSNDINDIIVSLGTSDNNLSDVVQTVYLMKGSTVIRSKTVSSGTYGVLDFDNLSESVDKDATQTYSVVADLKKESAYSDGTTLVASSTSSLSGWDVEDTNGNTATIAGGATGGIITLSGTGITVSAVTNTVDTVATADPATSGSPDIKTFNLNFTVTAGDDDLYIDKSVQRTGSPSVAGAGVAWATTTDSSSAVTSTTASIFSADTDGNNATGNDTATDYKVAAGSTRTFHLKVTLTATASGSTGVLLTGVNYTTDASDTTADNYYTSNLSSFKIDPVFMRVAP